MKKLSILIMTALLSASMVMPVFAVSKTGIVQANTLDDSISVYVSGVTADSSVEATVGTSSASVSGQAIANMSVPMKTLVMIDNSISIVDKDRKKISEILQNLISDRMNGELIAISTFSESTTYLCEYTDDYKQLKAAVDSITYNDQETYLTDVLYELVSNDFVGGEDVYSRIILVSDGVDNKSLGYTKDELNTLLKKNSLPIYTIGCSNSKKSNNEQLENMFAIARLTGADSVLLDDVSDALEVNTLLESDRDIVKYTVTPDASQLDGSTKAVKLDINGASYSVECSMPQKVSGGTAVTETIETEDDLDVEDTDADTEDADEEDEDEDDDEDKDYDDSSSDFMDNVQEFLDSEVDLFGYEIPMLYLLIAIVSLVIILIIIIIVIVSVSKKNKEKNKFEAIDENIFNNYQNPVVPEEKTEIIGSFRNTDDDEHTCMIWNTQESYHVILTDVNSPARSIQIPLSGKISIGRKPGNNAVFDYEKSVSSKHCEISVRDGHFYIKDLQSSNGTFVNDSKVLTEAEIVSGNIIKLGRLELRFEAR